MAVVPGVVHRLGGDDLGLFGPHLEHRHPGLQHRHPGLLADDAQLVDGGGAVDVAGHQQRAAALAAVELAQLGRVGGLAVALQTAHHQHGLALVLDAQGLGFLAAHQAGEFLVDDLDHLLGGGQAFHDLLAHRPFGHLGAEVLGHLVVDIGFQQRHAHFPHGRLDVRLIELALAAQLFEHAGQSLAQRFECHQSPSFRYSGVQPADDRQHFVGIAGDLRHRRIQTGVAAAHLHDQLLQPFQVGPLGAFPPGIAQPGFHIGQGGFPVFDRVPHPLPGDPVVFRDLRQGKVLVIVFGEDGALFVGQDSAVVVQQDRKLQVFLRFGSHGRASFPAGDVKSFFFTADEL